MEELADVVRAAQAGDLDAFGVLVRRFQDMAYASACALIGDAHLAEDVTQEAFLQAYFDLPMLREPAAFPGWFRRIVTLVLGGLADTRTQRRGTLLAALATAEQLRDEGHDVLFAVVATDTEWNILSRLLDRLPRIVGQGSITLVVLDIWWDGTPTPLSGIRAWDSWIMLDVARARGGFHPAVDHPASGSDLLAGPLLSEDHRRVASQARALLQQYPDLDREMPHPAANAGNPMDHLHAARAGRLRRFLTQPLFVQESVTGRPGKRVLVEDTISGVARLLDGGYDAVPEDSFLYIGDIGQALEGRRD